MRNSNRIQSILIAAGLLFLHLVCARTEQVEAAATTTSVISNDAPDPFVGAEEILHFSFEQDAS
ncbi:MAG: hypothetical protein R3C11_02455 [Planctomycetaceae bacterium]